MYQSPKWPLFNKLEVKYSDRGEIRQSHIEVVADMYKVFDYSRQIVRLLCGLVAIGVDRAYTRAQRSEKGRFSSTAQGLCADESSCRWMPRPSLSRPTVALNSKLGIFECQYYLWVSGTFKAGGDRDRGSDGQRSGGKAQGCGAIERLQRRSGGGKKPEAEARSGQIEATEHRIRSPVDRGGGPLVLARDAARGTLVDVVVGRRRRRLNRTQQRY
ncbi:hypothetical protein K438DRAFT_1930092 [Mycena galopus ATCC 62051]|nr:hypothetical protein K438DRAFT_1930092 [Mycena galopus ATCC 62051]